MVEMLRSERRGRVLHLVLDRPDVRNALNEELIAGLTEMLRSVGPDSELRAVVLRGEGKVFCAGADLAMMRRQGEADAGRNEADAQRLGAMFAAVSSCPRPVLAQVHGAALGGAVGLVAAADVAVAARGTRFGFTETRLGLVPGVISPYAVRRLGPALCRRLFLTAEIFDAEQALAMGLVDEVAEPDAMEDAVEAWLERLRVGGPRAQGAAKALLDDIWGVSLDEALRRTPSHIARQRATDEAREGTAAFFANRPPRWAQDDDGEQA